MTQAPDSVERIAQRASAFLRLDPDSPMGGEAGLAERWRPSLFRWLLALPERAREQVGEAEVEALLGRLEALFEGLSAPPRAPSPEQPGLSWPSQGARYLPHPRWAPERLVALPDSPALRAPRLRLRISGRDGEGSSERARLRRRYVLDPSEPWSLSFETLVLQLRLQASPEGGRAPEQRSLNARTEAQLLASLPPDWAELLGRPLPEGGSLLGRHLERFTTPDMEDSFVEPGLEARLRERLRQLARAPIAEARSPEQALQAWRKARALETLAEPLLHWRVDQERLRLAALEARPLVIRGERLLSLGLLPEPLQREIEACPAQRAQWAERYRCDTCEPGFLVDTHVLPPALRQAVLEATPGIEGPLTRGAVYLGENGAALRLLQARWAGRVDLTCIDPPYNTGGARFAYRDMYHRDTWLTMMRDRLELARTLSTPEGALALSIDDAELSAASDLAEQSWGPELAKLVWDRNRKNDARWFSVGHEYMLVHAADLGALKASGRRMREPKPGLDEARAHFKALRAQHGEDWAAIRAGWLGWFDGLPVGDPRRRMRRYTRVGPRGPYRDDGNINWPGGGGPRYQVRHPVTGRPCKQPRSGWRYPKPERFWEEVEAGRVVFGEDETTVPRVASYLFEGEGQVMPSVFYSYAQTAAQDFDAMFGARVFRNPKPWGDLARVLRYLGGPDAVVLDAFAGSGSTGHAVLHLNRVDGGERRFLLVEQGAHGQDVLLPRLAKAAYADAWSEGAPTLPSPTPTLIEVCHISGAPDALLHLDDDGQPWGTRLRCIWRPGASRLCVHQEERLVSLPIDWLESVNQRLGLRVTARERLSEGLELVRGVRPDGRRLLLLWRDRDRVDEPTLLAAAAALAQEGETCHVNGGVPSALSGWHPTEDLLRS
ncbi:MAG: hypothetical protein H6741_23055 [Alphaproteobacteria bacterium]|nr:hypothetical protein [Alphaproteobacteria bacterium]